MVTTKPVARALNVPEGLFGELAAMVSVPADRPKTRVVAPFTEPKRVGCPRRPAMTFSYTVARARAAQPSWARTPVRERESQTVAVQKLGAAFAPPGGLDYPTYQRLLGRMLKLMKHLPLYK